VECKLFPAEDVRRDPVEERLRPGLERALSVSESAFRLEWGLALPLPRCQARPWSPECNFVRVCVLACMCALVCVCMCVQVHVCVFAHLQL
jgi:hypothetical protein